jgi:cellulose synthase/poly-beta-1,6-N-acetylglucosamine synthase-like glycosyltransferase
MDVQGALYPFGKKIKAEMEVLPIILKILLYTASCIIAFYFVLPTLLFLLYYLFGGASKKPAFNKYKKTNDVNHEFAAIITAHQDTRFIAPLVDSFLKQNYSKFKVYIVADDCDITNIKYADDRIILLAPTQALHSKIKSIQFAISNFKNEPDVLIIFDSDNLVHPDYLKNLNEYFQRGFRVVQTHMLSKNTDNTYARLDSMGHIYYTFYERIVKMQLKMSSAILGLGVAIDFKLYQQINYEQTVGGFDKKLQSQLARNVKQIAFAENAIVYDEKVEDAAVMQKQRTRWIYSYFGHFKESWLLTKTGLKNFNNGQILLGVSMLRPPMVILILSMLILASITAFVNPILLYGWALIIVLFILTFVLTIATQSRQKGMFQSLKHIPSLIFSQLKSLLQIKKAKQNFLKTEHRRIIYIDDILKNEHL